VKLHEKSSKKILYYFAIFQLKNAVKMQLKCSKNVVLKLIKNSEKILKAI